MTRLEWGVVGERFYETGVDRGVLYVTDGDGVAWNGLVSVSEAPTGGESRPYYLDGVKYLNLSSGEEFEATIEAYTYPDEFIQCEGTAAIQNGLFVTQQSKKAFGLAYRTRIGNDVNGTDHGYKIHLVYNALAGPSPRGNLTISDTAEAFNFTWQITTKPPSTREFKPASHFIIDSRETPGDLLAILEDILYGASGTSPRLPSVSELLFIFNSYNTSIFDAGGPIEPYYSTLDGGRPPSTVQSSTVDGGVP